MEPQVFLLCCKVYTLYKGLILIKHWPKRGSICMLYVQNMWTIIKVFNHNSPFISLILFQVQLCRTCWWYIWELPKHGSWLPGPSRLLDIYHKLFFIEFENLINPNIINVSFSYQDKSMFNLNLGLYNKLHRQQFICFYWKRT